MIFTGSEAFDCGGFGELEDRRPEIKVLYKQLICECAVIPEAISAGRSLWAVRQLQ